MGRAAAPRSYTTSGQIVLDFTDDRDKLLETLNRIQPLATLRDAADCLDINYYWADAIINKFDAQAQSAAVDEVMACRGYSADQQALAEAEVHATAMSALSKGERESRLNLSVLKDVVRRLVRDTGQPERDSGLARVLPYTRDAPGRSRTDGSRDPCQCDLEFPGRARRLYAHSRRRREPTWARQHLGDELDAADGAECDVRGFRRDGGAGGLQPAGSSSITTTACLRDSGSWWLSRSTSTSWDSLPQNLKLDGTRHGLKVALKNPKGFELQARSAYYAPSHAVNSEEQAKEEIQEAVFSRDEIQELPVDLNLQYARAGDTAVKLNVLAKINLKLLHFRKVEDRNLNTLTVVSSVFDRNGNFVAGIQRIVDLRLRDQTLDSLNSGITVKTTLDITPGSYLVRLVVRDSEGQTMSARNGVVEIPF